jgi:hypothetical protein
MIAQTNRPDKILSFGDTRDSMSADILHFRWEEYSAGSLGSVAFRPGRWPLSGPRSVREDHLAAIPSLVSIVRTVRTERRFLHVLHRDSVKSALTANCQGSFDLSEQSSISVGIFHTRRPEKVDTGGGAAITLQ